MEKFGNGQKMTVRSHIEIPNFVALTSSQREANLHRDPVNINDEQSSRKVNEIYQKTKQGISTREMDYLTNKMMYDLRTGHPTPSAL